MTKDETCEQRIDGYYKSRMETIGTMLKGEQVAELDELTDDELGEIEGVWNVKRDELDIERVNEHAMSNLDDMPLSVEVFRTVKITLGTGGPGDWFECRVDDDGQIERIDYHFNDWFDHAERIVPESDSAAWDFCRRFVESITMS